MNGLFYKLSKCSLFKVKGDTFKYHFYIGPKFQFTVFSILCHNTDKSTSSH